jgi:hypothetical protein
MVRRLIPFDRLDDVLNDVALLHLAHAAHAAGGTDVYGRSLSSAVAPGEAVAALG